MKYFIVVSMGIAFAQTLQASESDELGTSTVLALRGDALGSRELSNERISQLPGGASLIDPETWTGSIIKPEDIFQFDPGVYARSSGTANDSRLSVRGSGIQRRYGSRGVSLQLDGVGANHSDGSYYFRVIDPLTVSHITSYRGANGLAYGGNQLGGAIDISTKTGLTDPGSYFQAEVGSYETYRAAFQTAGSKGSWDYFFGYSYTESDGYRSHQNWHSHHFTANVGYHWSDTSLTRFYLLFNDSDGLLAGGLTADEFAANPQFSSGEGSATDRDLSTIRLSQRTSWETDNGAWQFATTYQYLDFDHLTTEAGMFFPVFDNLVDYDTDEAFFNFRGHEDYQIFGKEHTVRFNFDYSYGVNEVGGSTAFGAAGINDRKETSSNLNVYAENQTKLNDQHSVIYGLGYVNSQRKREIRGGDTTGRTGFDDGQEGMTWRFGHLFQQDDNISWFANVSQSFESAPFSEASTATVTNPQEAITFEAGTRFSAEWITGEFTVYTAKVNEEFVYEETGPGSGTFIVTNADTTHTGIEAAGHIDINRALKLQSPLQFAFDFSYQLNDFTFDEGPAAGNQIPVVSNQVIASRFTVADKEQRWKAALSVDWLPEGLVADNNNTLTTAGYATWDLYGEYQVNSSVTLYAGISNLFDKQYASTVTVNPSGADPAFINPGDGRSAYLGIKARW